MSLFLGPGIGSADWRPRTSSPPPGPALPASLAETGSHSPVPIGDPWALADRTRSRDEANCGHFHVIAAHRATGMIRPFPTGCYKPSCPKCGPRILRQSLEALATIWAAQNRIWIADLDDFTTRDWERIDKRRKRNPDRLPNFLRFELSDESAWIFSDADLNDSAGRWITRESALGCVRDLLALRDPLPVVVKVSASKAWKLPATRPAATGDYRRLYDGCPESLRDTVRQKAETRACERLGVQLDLSEYGAIPPAYIEEAKQIIAEVVAEEIAWSH